MEMFVLGAALGSLVLLTERWSPSDASEHPPTEHSPTERRRRVLTDAQAIGYRAALGETPDR